LASKARKRKDELYGGLAASTKALANAHRLELLELLAQAPRTVEVLAEMSGLSTANASQHLQVLKTAAMVESEKVGSFVTYRLAGDDVATMIVALRALAARCAARMGTARAALGAEASADDGVDREELLRRVRRREVVVLDVRPAEEFAAAHLPAAVSIPIRELARRLDELPRSRDIVAYCRGPFCVFASEAVAILTRAGFRASELSDGVAEWRARGLPLDSASMEVPS